MNRRDFLKKAGMGAAAVSVAACAPKAAKELAAAPAEHKLEGTMAQNTPGVSLLGYGAMRWPMTKDADGKDIIDQEKVNELVDTAIAHGINYFDASPTYLGGDCERATSEALNRYPREKWLLATKMSNFSNWTLENSKLMYQESLRVYKTDHIDYYLLHAIGDMDGFNTRFGSTGIMDFLMEERKAGRIRNLGFSFHGSRQGLDDLLSLHDKYHWDFVQIQMNYVDWFNGDAEYLYNALDALEIHIVIMEPLLGGRLGDVPAPLAEKLKAMDPGSSIASWAFRFCGSYPRVLTVLSGMTYMEHLQDNLDTYLDFKPLTESEMAALKEIAELLGKYPLIGCTGCQYCMPCPYGIDIPGIFRFYNKTVNEGTYVVSQEQKDYARARRRYLASYDKAVETVRQADHCISCGKCMKQCPQRIRIPRELRRINEYVEQLKQGIL